jgi:hypothetical protein
MLHSDSSWSSGTGTLVRRPLAASTPKQRAGLKTQDPASSRDQPLARHSRRTAGEVGRCGHPRWKSISADPLPADKRYMLRFGSTQADPPNRYTGDSLPVCISRIQISRCRTSPMQRRVYGHQSKTGRECHKCSTTTSYRDSVARAGRVACPDAYRLAADRDGPCGCRKLPMPGRQSWEGPCRCRVVTDGERRNGLPSLDSCANRDLATFRRTGDRKNCSLP